MLCSALLCPALPCPALPRPATLRCPALLCSALNGPALPCCALLCPALPCSAWFTTQMRGGFGGAGWNAGYTTTYTQLGMHVSFPSFTRASYVLQPAVHWSCPACPLHTFRDVSLCPQHTLPIPLLRSSACRSPLRYCHAKPDTLVFFSVRAGCCCPSGCKPSPWRPSSYLLLF